ncbi:Extradiol ring-cleavage dioxygenase, class III enzyme, subunit B [Infundibulicybe gibba]|nr:Extradiol ring-cleavage dioxygenase, class III enzyme, subunit B [Infundibulicybe gibba]
MPMSSPLESLPSTPNNIPSFFFGHGSPILAFQESDAMAAGPMGEYAGPTGPLAAFLKEFGPALLQKYTPKGIVVFSAHWETRGERLVTDYGDNNPLLMDYYGFQPDLYKLKFKSRGDSALATRVVNLYTQSGHKARTTSSQEPRGEDGRGFVGPGLDHGVFVPFRIMFGEEFTSVPIIQVSIESSLSPEDNWALGKAVAQLRREGILILSGGLTIHNLRERACFVPKTARPIYKEFDQAVLDAVSIVDAEKRKTAMIELTKHAGFRASHPREEHFVPIYVAAGAGGTSACVLSSVHGAPTVAFGDALVT